MKAIADITHKRLSKDGRETQDTLARFKDALSDPIFKGIRSISYLIEPLLKYLYGFLAVDLDAHTNNYLVSRYETIYKLDNSERGLAPSQFDTAKMIEGTGRTSRLNREELLKEYIRGSQETDVRGYILGHYIGTIIKSLTKHIFCKKKELVVKRTFQNEERKGFLLNARDVISCLKTDFSQVYRTEKTSFDGLEKMVTYLM